MPAIAPNGTAPNGPFEALAAPSRRQHEAVPRPLLASEALAEERAPLQPWRVGVRLALLSCAVSLTVLGLGVWAGVGLPGEAAALSFSAAAGTAMIAVVPFAYPVRAAMTTLVGVALMTLGLQGMGPLAGLTVDGGTLKDLERMVVGSALPSALLLRARYPTFQLTRLLLGCAFLLAVPLLVTEVVLAVDHQLSWVTRLAAGTVAILLTTSVAGALGDGNLGFSSPWAWLILVAIPGEIALRQFTLLAGAGAGWLTYPATGLAMACASLLVSLGLAQLGASVIAPRARAALRGQLRKGSTPHLNTQQG